MNLKILFKPYVNCIIIIGLVLGVYSWTMDTRPVSPNEFFFLICAISLMWWEDNISNDIRASFSASISILLLCMFGIKIAILVAIGCSMFSTLRRHINGTSEKHLLYQKIFFNISHSIIASFVVWKLNNWLNVDYVHITDCWKVIALSGAYFSIGLLLVNLVMIFQTGTFSLLFKDSFTHIFYSIIMSVLLIYTYYDRGLLGILFIFIMFIPLQKLTKMYSKLKLQEQELFTDSLTQVYNYRFFKSVMHNRIAKRIPFTLIYMDLNDFKSINDKFGHEIGNRILEHFTELLKKKLIDESIICRFGGDEFCIITNGNPKDNELLLLFLNNKKNFFIIVDGNRIDYTASYGLSYYDGKKEIDWRIILESADKEMYQYKKNYNEERVYI